MSDLRQAFHRAISDYPRDPAPRLVYADWLDEHGEPTYAEFQRVMAALTPLGSGNYVFRPWRMNVRSAGAQAETSVLTTPHQPGRSRQIYECLFLTQPDGWAPDPGRGVDVQIPDSGIVLHDLMFVEWRLNGHEFGIHYAYEFVSGGPVDRHRQRRAELLARLSVLERALQASP